MQHLRQHMPLIKIFNRFSSSQQQSKMRHSQSSKPEWKSHSKNKKVIIRSPGALWEPFREVLSDQEADKTSVVDGSMALEGIGAAARFWGVAPHEAHERAADTVTPLWRLDYGRQLTMKQARVRALLRQLAGRLVGSAPPANGCGSNALPFPLDRIVPSPQVDGYRNKEEYKIGEGVDGDPKTVGFIFSSPAHGPALCLPGDRLKNCKPQHARLALAFQDFVRTSPLAACSRLDDGGHWRLLMVRSNRADQLLAAVTFHPQQLPVAAVEAERQRLREYFSSGLGAACGLHSLLFQECPHARCSAEQAPYQSLFGPGVLEDRLGPVRFLVSPDSFFQVNCAAAEVLYGVVRRQARLTPASVLLDLCSGTGPVSLLMARHCRTCVGIEASRSAVRDANENAAMNNIQNVEFIAGRIEKELSPVVADLDLCSDMVAVVNPGRDGVGWTGAAFPVDTRRARRSVPAHGPSGAGADLREVVSVLT
ncbi:tRNA (uracil(54)-C(5))-methyltransferase homolog isoform X2 [Pollicipes pollicipes]|uniref:tRNA (uracil(54)-C(5))-methyltransferase homolog isoform X2 n=1 Tax=Pollicipes pollicipes TaxID=41117 RepID=UPI001885057D|nr:tRNA (uracil(54)-C(5))-methyltransferase homolog isoform X2 [Pollicipes pollicipes]